jgi:hypothetical protein
VLVDDAGKIVKTLVSELLPAPGCSLPRRSRCLTRYSNRVSVRKYLENILVTHQMTCRSCSSPIRGWVERVKVNLQGFLERVWVAEGAIMDRETCALGTELAQLNRC